MAGYTQLKQAISDVIKQNGKQEITGNVLQSVLLSMVNIIGVNSTFAGVAEPDTSPGMPDQNVFYLAFDSGNYVNFGGVSLPKDSIAIFENKTGAWLANIYELATGKINISDIVDNLTTSDDKKVLSAKQGVELKNLIDDKQDELVSGVNIATINGQDITKGGDVEIQTGIKNVKTINGEAVDGTGNIAINQTINELQWTTNAATTRKLVPEELRAKDVRISYTNNNGVYIVEKYTAEAIDDTSWANDANWKGCRTPLTPLFEKYTAKFNDETGHYSLNGYDDIDENEMMEIFCQANLNSGFPFRGHLGYANGTRTNIPFLRGGLSAYNDTFTDGFCTRNRIETLVLGGICTYFDSLSFNNCPNLKEIKTNATSHGETYGDISLYNNSAIKNWFNNCPKLEYVLVQGIRYSCSIFKDSPLINYASMEFLVRKASTSISSPIELTINPTTYGYLTGTIQPTPEVGGTTEEWQQIVTDAQAKQISFVTE